MTSFADAQVSAINDLQLACGDRPLVLIGAMALNCHFQKWEGTRDLDLSVAASINELESITKRLAGWQQVHNQEHSWLSPDRVLVDLLPAGPEILRAGEIVWPETGRRMNMIGFRLALDWTVSFEINASRPLRVAAVPSIVLLKMAAYLDRPLERDRDLRDLSHIWTEYEDSGDGRFLDEVISAGIEFEHAGAFLIGHELASRINAQERMLAEEFLAKLSNESDPDHTLERMARGGVRSLKETPEAWLAYGDALRRGLASP